MKNHFIYDESLYAEGERLFAIRYPHAQVNMKVEEPRPSVHVHVVPIEQELSEPQKEPSVDEKCPLCDKP